MKLPRPTTYQPTGHFIFSKERYLSGCQLPVTDYLPLIASDLVWYPIGCAYIGLVKFAIDVCLKSTYLWLMLRIAIDIGGTFTDVVAETPSGFTSAKVLTTPKKPEQAALVGLGKVLTDLAKSPSDITAIVHRLVGLRAIGPVAVLIVGILGSLYAGLASISELAAIGVLGAVLLSVLMGTFSISELIKGGRRAVRTSSMIGLIIIGAACLNSAFGFLGIPKAIAAQIAGFGLSPIALIMVLLVFYSLLGMFLDGTSIIVMTLPITLPLVVSAGYDPIWFGIFVVVAVEISQITPPIGFNLFVIQSQTGEPIGTIARAALPFFFILLGFALLLTLFPSLALWLPATIQ